MSHYNTLLIGKREIRYYYWGEYHTIEEAMRVFNKLKMENLNLDLSYYIVKAEDSWVGGMLPTRVFALYINRRLRL